MLITDNEKNYSELLLIINPFYNNFEESELKIFHATKSTKSDITIDVKIGDKSFSYIYPSTPNMYKDNKLDNKYVKRFGKIALYRALCQYTGKALPWGSLTGVRPSKLFYECIKEGLDPETTFTELYQVSKEKTAIVADIVQHQQKRSQGEKDIHLYLHIPFCPSKCTYCSFVSYSNKKYNEMLPKYVDKLILEVKETLSIIKKKKYNLRTVYIGGGTPTILANEDLDRLLAVLPKNIEEFTVESGRAETISLEKLQTMKKHGVTRVCVNPQSFNKKVLKEVNRPANFDAIKEDICNAKKLGLTVNMDLIAGLPKDTVQSFKNSLKKCISFHPDNITVHTLAIKNASQLRQDKFAHKNEKIVSKMVDYAYKKLHKNEYFPYYLYRQKHMMANLENIGYAKAGTECIFNIDSMEETASIVACGAGGISKRFFRKENRIERYANIKDIPQYMDRVEEIAQKKLELY